MQKKVIIISSISITVVSIAALVLWKIQPITKPGKVLDNKILSHTKSRPESVKSRQAKIPGIGPNTVVTGQRWLDNNTVEIDFQINAAEREPVFGTAVNLTYNREVLEYQSFKRGDFLEQAGSPAGNRKPVYLVSRAKNDDDSSKEQLIIGATLFRGTPGVTGSGRLITLRFKAKKKLSSEIRLTKAALKNLQAKNITSMVWPDSITIKHPQI